LLIALIDYNHRSEISFALFYLIPVIISSYQNIVPFKYTVMISIISTASLSIVDHYKNSYSTWTNELLNCIPKFIFSIIIPLAIHQYFYEKELRRKIEIQKEELNIANQQLNQANAELNKFIGMAAHDIRNPVGGIQTVAEMLLENESMIDEQKNLIRMIQLAAIHSLQILNDTLNISMIQSGTISMNKTMSDFISFIKESIILNKYLADKKNQTIKFESDIDQLEMNFDRSRLSEVLNNLLTNAIKYSNMNTCITIKITYDGNNREQVLTSIMDRGLGIDKKYHATLFDPFTTTINKPTDNESKTGLGLAIVKRIVQLHNGTIGFTSEKGKGSNFYFSIPIES
jgi:signal transduction histidine kinase